jgi:Putative beta-barrel porin-2, OmpL-like. bbp2
VRNNMNANTKRTKLNLKFLSLIFVASTIGAAQSMADEGAKEAPKDGAKPEVSFSGFVDGYYSFNFNQPSPVPQPSNASVASAGLPAATNSYRFYDSYHNQMTLSLAELSILAKYEEVSALVDLDFGSYADFNSAGPYPQSNVVDSTSKNIGQAIVSFHKKDSRFYFDAGKMYSHLGVETTKSKDNFNYSRSILFSYAMPFWATGVHLGYDLEPGKWQISGYVYNGWNELNDVNRAKTLGLQVKYTPTSDLALVYNFIGGAERADSESDLRMVHELNASWNASAKLSFIADLVYGSENNAPVGVNHVNAQWYGILVGAKYAWNSVAYFSPRLEAYRDDGGYTLSGPSQSVESLTLTYGREIRKGFEVRGEARGDFSDQSVFLKGSGTNKVQTTLLTSMIFKF